MRQAYDIIIIGGGHNGLVAAIELANAGRSVCVVEARFRTGGCAVTTEPLLPKFKHNPHANNLVFADIFLPAITPSALNVPTIQPEAQFGVAFADGRPPVILHRPDLLAKTQKSLAVYSERDASQYVQMKRRSAAFGSLLRRGFYAAPNAVWFEEQRKAVAKAYQTISGTEKLGHHTARQLIDRSFEADEVRLLLYALAIETGVALEEPGGDLAFLGLSVWIAGRWRQPTGGMQVYSDALVNTARKLGVQIMESAPVQRVLVENGRATGVRTTAGLEIDAAQAVIASIPILTLFDDLLADQSVSSTERAEVEAFRRTSTPSIGTTALCLTWAPRYKSGRHDADIDHCLKTVVGFEAASDVLAQVAEVDAGLLPRPAGTVRIQSLWDSTLAPPGNHVAAVDSSFPRSTALDGSTWQQVVAAFPMAFFDTWQRYLIEQRAAPPMTMTSDDTLGFERRMLMRLGKDQYRTSIGGLYLAGPGVYPGGGVHGACGHNAARTAIGDNPRMPIRNQV